MQSPLALIGTSWSFYRKHPVLNHVTLWLLFVPLASFVVIASSIVTSSGEPLIVASEPTPSEFFVYVLPITALVIYFVLWGAVCIFSVGKRMLGSEAGRSRTSFSAVRKESRKFILPIFTIGIIRSAITLLWALLLIIPGIIYATRTVFFSIILVKEGTITYDRSPLTKSIEQVTGHTWSVLWRILICGVLCIGTAFLFEFSLINILAAVDAQLILIGVMLSLLIDSYAIMLFLLSLVALYADLTKP